MCSWIIPIYRHSLIMDIRCCLLVSSSSSPMATPATDLVELVNASASQSADASLAQIYPCSLCQLSNKAMVSSQA
jgi:hypothetical protein